MRVRNDEVIRNQIIKSVITKCRKDTVEATLRKWGRLSDEVLYSLTRKTKDRIVQTLIEAIEEDADMTDEVMGDLELAYIQLHSKAKLWHVFKLSGSEMKLSIDPRVLRSQLLTSVQLKWKRGRVFGNMGIYNGVLWLRVHLGMSLSKRKAEHCVYNPTQSVFLLTFAGSPFVLISKTSSPIFKIVSEALIQVLKAERLTDIKLSGRHVTSLADIALRKNNEASIHSYRELEETESTQVTGQKRKLADHLEDRDDIVDENRQEKKIRHVDIVNKFGPDPQPILETLEYNFDLPFRGKPSGAATSVNCKSIVQLKGPSVLQGLSEMARKGFLKFPLPQHLCGATSSQRNRFSIISRRERPQ